MLKLDPHNANRGTDRGRRAVADSLAECGAGRSILVDRDGTVIAGPNEPGARTPDIVLPDAAWDRLVTHFEGQKRLVRLG